MEAPEKKKSFWLLPLILITKSAKLIKLVKIFKLLKFTKFFITFFTMALSALVYSFMLGPWFAVGFVAMLFVHEMGHIIAMNRKGYKTSAPVFIPMLGAVIFAPEFKNSEDEAYIGFGGPFVGGLAAFAVFALWAILPQKYELLLLIGYTAAFINLFNMLPIRPLDGGRITQLIGGWFKWIGLAGLLWLTILIKEPSILLIWIVVLQDIKLQPSFKFGTAVVGVVGMAILMSLGYSDQQLWVDILDVILACGITATFYIDMKRSFSGKSPYSDNNVCKERIDAPTSIKIKWFVFYVLLLVGLIVLMSVQIQYLPQNLQN